ncbi:MAG: hypothetical protein AAB855_05320, partial [Patescibacteria group bacterium]
MTRYMHQLVKKVVYPMTMVSMVLWSLGPALLPTPVQAGITILTNVSSVSTPQTLGPSSAITPLLNMNTVADAGETFASANIVVTPSAGFAMSDLGPLDGEPGNTAFSLIRDNGTTQGTYDASDTAINTAAPIMVTDTLGADGVRRIQKITPPSGPRTTDSTDVLAVGDLVYGKISAGGAPTGRYDWHIVTTSAAINSANLRLDGAGVQPTYTGARVSPFAPASTGEYTINGTSNTTSPALAAGDIIYYQLVPVAGTGTIASSGTTVTGTGTAFMTQLAIGDIITASGQTKTISAITSNTSLTVDSAFTANLPGGTSFTFSRGGWRMVTGTFTASASPVNGGNLPNGTYRISKVNGQTGLYNIPPAPG